jgi:hypothetical protein
MVVLGGVMQIVTYLYIVVLEECVCVCVSCILYQCWLVVTIRCKPSGMLHCVSESVVPNISEAMRSFFGTGKYWPSSTASHPRRLECAAALLCERQILCRFGLFVLALLLLTLSTRICLGKSSKCLIAVKYQGWWCQMFAVHSMFILYYCQHLHGWVTLLSWNKLTRCTV